MLRGQDQPPRTIDDQPALLAMGDKMKKPLIAALCLAACCGAAQAQVDANAINAQIKEQKDQAVAFCAKHTKDCHAWKLSLQAQQQACKGQQDPTTASSACQAAQQQANTKLMSLYSEGFMPPPESYDAPGSEAWLP
jgi:hypothetical protein